MDRHVGRVGQSPTVLWSAHRLVAVSETSDEFTDQPQQQGHEADRAERNPDDGQRRPHPRACRERHRPQDQERRQRSLVRHPSDAPPPGQLVHVVSCPSLYGSNLGQRSRFCTRMSGLVKPQNAKTSEWVTGSRMPRPRRLRATAGPRRIGPAWSRTSRQRPSCTRWVSPGRAVPRPHRQSLKNW